jgi:RNA polymerase sigma-70 factor (ECF subfamily)
VSNEEPCLRNLAEVEALSDEALVARIRAGEAWLFELVMRRHNGRLYRAVRAWVKDESEAEDVMQQAYFQAFVHLHQFEGRASLATWLTQIALHEARARLKKGARAHPNPEEAMAKLPAEQSGPEKMAADRQLVSLVEEAIDRLPDGYREVLMLREVEGLSTDETAQCLGLKIEAAKVRLHRARALLRRDLTERLGASSRDAFTFPAQRCDRVVAAVLSRLGI